MGLYPDWNGTGGAGQRTGLGGIAASLRSKLDSRSCSVGPPTLGAFSHHPETPSPRPRAGALGPAGPASGARTAVVFRTEPDPPPTLHVKHPVRVAPRPSEATEPPCAAQAGASLPRSPPSTPEKRDRLCGWDRRTTSSLSRFPRSQPSDQDHRLVPASTIEGRVSRAGDGSTSSQASLRGPQTSMRPRSTKGSVDWGAPTATPRPTKGLGAGALTLLPRPNVPSPAESAVTRR